ncbi:hypothetical protein DIPPA_30096 [Diplonema papillatum]|nr:hypothetical protein DIPPA_30096 [Diplonema papillatum]
MTAGEIDATIAPSSAKRVMMPCPIPREPPLTTHPLPASRGASETIIAWCSASSLTFLSVTR